MRITGGVALSIGGMRPPEDTVGHGVSQKHADAERNGRRVPRILRSLQGEEKPGRTQPVAQETSTHGEWMTNMFLYART